MSIKVMSRVWDEMPYDQTSLLILLCLADHANDDGVCWPSVTRLAHRARCTERWARDVLGTLEKDGVLERKLRPGHTTMYRIVFPAKGPTPEPQISTEETSPRNPSSSPPRNPSSGDPGTPVPMNHKEPSFESSKTPVVVDTQVSPTRIGRRRWWPSDRALATAQEETKLVDIGLSIARYEVVCAEKKKQPSDAEWLRWLIEDEKEARKEERRFKESNKQTSEWYE